MADCAAPKAPEPPKECKGKIVCREVCEGDVEVEEEDVKGECDVDSNIVEQLNRQLLNEYREALGKIEDYNETVTNLQRDICEMMNANPCRNDEEKKKLRKFRTKMELENLNLHMWIGRAKLLQTEDPCREWAKLPKVVDIEDYDPCTWCKLKPMKFCPKCKKEPKLKRKKLMKLMGSLLCKVNDQLPREDHYERICCKVNEELSEKLRTKYTNALSRKINYLSEDLEKMTEQYCRVRRAMMNY